MMASQSQAGLLGVLRQQSQQGDPAAMTALAKCLLDQNPASVDDHEEASRWLELAMEQGHAPAMVMRGVWYEHLGEYTRAATCYMKAALAGDAEGASLLGGRYVSGRGLAKSVAKGLFWLSRAVEQGDTFAMMALAAHYESGEGLPRDIHKAISLYERAGDGGQIEVWQELALLLGDEQCEVFDYARSLAYLKKAVEAGDMSAWFELGAALYLAPPALRDLDTARVAFEHAEALGDPEARDMIDRLRDELSVIVPIRPLTKV
jgi:TPR repeat protein